MNNAQLINQTNKSNTEYYTPFHFIEAARAAMGGIDYDPASSAKANGYIQADNFCAAPGYEIVDHICQNQHDDGLPVREYYGRGGLDRMWYGRMWMNHPFGQAEKACNLLDCSKVTCLKRGYHLASDLPGNEDWINKMVESYLFGNVKEAYMICFANTSETWFRPLKAFPQCYIDGRVNYLDPETLKPVKGATKGSVITYFGENLESFYQNFGIFGDIHIPYTWDLVTAVANRYHVDRHELGNAIGRLQLGALMADPEVMAEFKAHGVGL